MAAPARLSAAVSRFVGRKQELADLRALIGETRLLTLTGTGGSGKTRLALELAARVAERFDEGAFFVDLAPLTDAALVPSTIAVALDIRQEPGRPLLDTIVDRLAQPSMVILDNLEHLPGAVPVIAELVARCPGLVVLATSRAPLHLRGEREYTVDPLALPAAADLTSPERLARTDAVALFIDRARAVDPRFELTTGNSAAIAEICRRLDGLPLAIELAAARSRMLAPDALLRRLERRLSLLTAGPSDAPPRQRTLRDTIAWSYYLLSESDRLVFARTAVFAGSFSLAAAEAVIAAENEPAQDPLLDPLSRLVDHNLLRVSPDTEGEPRFRLLETIREFGLEHLSEREAEAARARHAAYFALVAETARSHGGHASPVLLQRFTDDPENLRAALAWANDHGDADLLIRLAVALRVPFGVVGHPEEAGRWLHAAEVVATSARPELRAALLYELVRYQLNVGGDRGRAERLLDDALGIHEELGNVAGKAGALMMLSNVAADRGDREAAADRARRAVALARTVADPVERTRLLAESANMGSAARSLAEARALAEEVLVTARELGDPVSLTDGLVALGGAALATGEVALAVESLSEAVAVQQPGGPDLGWAMQSLAPALLRAGDLDGSRTMLLDVLSRAREGTTIYFKLGALEAAADWLSATGRPAPATVLWAAVDAQRAVQMDRTYNDDVGLYIPSREGGRAALSGGEYEAALATGKGMQLRDALDYASDALETATVESPPPTVAGKRPDGRYGLTARELEVLQLLCVGRSNEQIAEALFITKRTAAVHVGNIKGKLGAGNRVEIVTIAQARGLVAPSALPSVVDR